MFFHSHCLIKEITEVTNCLRWIHVTVRKVEPRSVSEMEMDEMYNITSIQISPYWVEVYSMTSTAQQIEYSLASLTWDFHCLWVVVDLDNETGEGTGRFTYFWWCNFVIFGDFTTIAHPFVLLLFSSLWIGFDLSLFDWTTTRERGRILMWITDLIITFPISPTSDMIINQL